MRFDNTMIHFLAMKRLISRPSLKHSRIPSRIACLILLRRYFIYLILLFIIDLNLIEYFNIYCNFNFFSSLLMERMGLERLRQSVLRRNCKDFWISRLEILMEDLTMRYFNIIIQYLVFGWWWLGDEWFWNWWNLI